MDLLVVVDLTTVLKQVSPSFERVLGWTKEEVISKQFYDFLHPDDIEKTQAVFRAHETGKNAVLFVNRYRCKDGSYRWISWNSHPLTEKQIIVGIGRDITERKKAEDSLQNTERLLSAVTDGSSDAIYVKDCQSRWLFVNPAIERITGKPSSELLGKNDLEIYANPEIGKTMMANDLRVMKSGKAETIEETVESTNGLRHFISDKVPRFDDNGQVIGLIGISSDITERKKAEEAAKSSKLFA